MKSWKTTFFALFFLSFILGGASSCVKDVDIIGDWSVECADYGGNPSNPGGTTDWSFSPDQPEAPMGTMRIRIVDSNGLSTSRDAKYSYMKGVLTVMDDGSTGSFIYHVNGNDDGSATARSDKEQCSLKRFTR
jgi:hypothetical protein